MELLLLEPGLESPVLLLLCVHPALLFALFALEGCARGGTVADPFPIAIAAAAKDCANRLPEGKGMDARAAREEEEGSGDVA